MTKLTLSDEAEQLIVKHNLNISQSTREALQIMNNDPDRQSKWVVNPLMQWCVENTMTAMQSERSQYVTPTNVELVADDTTTTIDIVMDHKADIEPATAPGEEIDEEGFGGLFD